MKMKLLSGAGIACGIGLAVSLAMPVSAVGVYRFAFDNDVAAGGNMPGTVSGRIVGLADNATSAATGVYIDSVPVALRDLGPFPVDAFSYYNQIDSNSFTVAGGMIVAAEFRASTSSHSPWLFMNYKGETNFLGSATNQFYVWNESGLAGLRFTPLASAPGPLPALGVTAAIGLSRRLRRRLLGRSGRSTLPSALASSRSSLPAAGRPKGLITSP